MQNVTFFEPGYFRKFLESAINNQHYYTSWAKYGHIHVKVAAANAT